MKKLIGMSKLCLILSHLVGKKTSLTTGVFDVPHKAHRIYLKKAREMGDLLILFLQSDHLIELRKGPDRPIRNQKVRLRRVKNYAFVDYIVIVDSYAELYSGLKKINPDIFVMSETTEDDETGVRVIKKLFPKLNVVVLPPQSNKHSSDIIKMKGLKRR